MPGNDSASIDRHILDLSTRAAGIQEVNGDLHDKTLHLHGELGTDPCEMTIFPRCFPKQPFPQQAMYLSYDAQSEQKRVLQR